MIAAKTVGGDARCLMENENFKDHCRYPRSSPTPTKLQIIPSSEKAKILVMGVR